MCPIEIPPQFTVGGTAKIVTPPGAVLPPPSSGPLPPPPPPPLSPPPSFERVKAQISAHKAKSASVTKTSNGSPSPSVKPPVGIKENLMENKIFLRAKQAQLKSEDSGSVENSGNTVGSGGNVSSAQTKGNVTPTQSVPQKKKISFFKPQVNADVDGGRGALLAEIREGFKLRPASRNDKSDDGESKEQSTPPKPIVHKQKDVQSVADKSKKQPAIREIETQTVEKTVTTGDIGTQTVEKTVTTGNKVLMCLAAISLLCAPFVAGLYSPAVIAWISGAASIAVVAVPVAICATFTLVAAASAIYLLRSIVSPASSKKEVGHSEEKSAKPIEGNTALQKPQKVVGHDKVDGEKKEPVSVPVTLGTQPSPTNNVPPPPPPPPLQVAKGAIAAPPPPPPPPLQVAKDAGAPPPPPPPPLQVAKGAGAPPLVPPAQEAKPGRTGTANLKDSSSEGAGVESGNDSRKAFLAQINGGFKLRNKEAQIEFDEGQKALKQKRKEGESNGEKGAESSVPKSFAELLAETLDTRFNVIHSPDSESEHSSSDSESSGWGSDDQTTPVQPKQKVRTKKLEKHKKPQVPTQSEEVKKAKQKLAQKQKSRVLPEAASEPASEPAPAPAPAPIAKPRTIFNVVSDHVNSETQDGGKSTTSVKRLADRFGGAVGSRTA